jgi:hypothetical protein
MSEIQVQQPEAEQPQPDPAVSDEHVPPDMDLTHKDEVD